VKPLSPEEALDIAELRFGLLLKISGVLGRHLLWLGRGDVRKRGRNSNVLKKSRRPFTRLLMGSISRVAALIGRIRACE
jgi:hypothetical protein